MRPEPIDLIPMWCFFPLIAVIGLLAMEGGYRFGKWRVQRKAAEKDASLDAMVASILGLLAFMLAFTFSLAAARFDARRQAVFEEANSIGTTYLRARLLPEPQRSKISDLLRQYTENRVQQVAKSQVDDLLTQSGVFHEQLWSQAMEAVDQDPRSIMTNLFLQSLNETINQHSKRVFVGLQSRIPVTIWIALFSLTLFGMASVGYQAGQNSPRRSPEMPILVLAFAGVLFLNVDLDRPQEGLLRVSQQPMIDVLKNLQPAAR